MPSRRNARRPSAATDRWEELADNELLEWRFSELGLNLSNSPVGTDVADLHASLERRGIGFRPHVWLSTEWFSPDGIPGIAIPFFAAHPRLARLERRMKGEVEGGNRRVRQRILRHEAGHALDTAFGLRRRPGWRAVFGRASKPYPTDYPVRPASRRFVQHLGHWYAQSHPTEDFAETFAVWLQPKARWRREYAGWPALDKLEYVDELMREIAGRRPSRIDRTLIAPLSGNRRKLGDHYRRQKRAEYLSERRYDDWLLRAFKPRHRSPDALRAAGFLVSVERTLKQGIMRRTGVGSYLFNHVSDTLKRRARELDLVLRGDRRDARKRARNLYERVIEDLLRRNRERYVL